MSKRAKSMTDSLEGSTTDAPQPAPSISSSVPTFTEQDVENAKHFGGLLGKAEFKLSLQDVIEFHKLLVWYNSLVNKIGDHIMEVKSIKKAP